MKLGKRLLSFLIAGCVSSFQLHSPTPSSSTLGQLKGGRFQAAPSSDETTSKDRIEAQDEETTTLTLSGKIEISSSAVPLMSQEKFSTFVKAPESRNLLVSAGGKRRVEELELTPQLLALWKNACDELGAQCPDESDSVVEVRTGGIDFPGLHLEILAVIGIKDVRNSQNKKLYELVLIQGENKARGLAPVVWIFNKLTGAGEKDSEDRQSSLSLTTLSYEVVNDSEIVFSISGRLTIKVKFPAFLLKILPTNKEKAEESGGKSIYKILEKDGSMSMAAYEKAYLKTIS
jgi:hypothetical protein